jgi:hypothetical protein
MHKSAHLTRFCPACGVENQTRIIQSSTGADEPPPLDVPTITARFRQAFLDYFSEDAIQKDYAFHPSAVFAILADVSARLRAEQQEG